MAIVGTILNDYRDINAVVYNPSTVPTIDVTDVLLPVNTAMVVNQSLTLLPEWQAKVSIIPPTIADTGNVRIGIGMDDGMAGGGRDTYLVIDQATNTLKFGLPYYNLIYKTVNIPSSFNYQNFSMSIRYKDLYLSAFITDGTNNITFQYLYNLFSNPIGRIAIKNYGTAKPRINTFQASSQLKTSPDILFLGDSITAGNGDYPSSTRYADRIKEKFAIANNFKNIQVWASGNAVTQDMINVVDAVKAVTPQKIVILIGDNDNRNNLTAWKPLIKSLIDSFTSVGIPVISLAMTIDISDPHTLYSDWMLDNTAGGMKVTLANPSSVTVIDTLTPECIGGVRTNPDSQYVVADGTHQSRSGNILLANLIYPSL